MDPAIVRIAKNAARISVFPLRSLGSTWNTIAVDAGENATTFLRQQYQWQSDAAVRVRSYLRYRAMV